MPPLLHTRRSCRHHTALLLAMSLTVCVPTPAGSADAAPAPAGAWSTVSPSDVFAALDLVDRVLDRLVEERAVTPPSLPPLDESALGPLHAYQIILACNNRLQQFNTLVQGPTVPTIVASPRVYRPHDVYQVVAVMLDNTRQLAKDAGITDLPDRPQNFEGKKPTDVFRLGAEVYFKLVGLCGQQKISPNAVFAEMVRGTDDVRSILRQADPASRYRIDAPHTDAPRKPADVLRLCLEIRQQINAHRRGLGMTEVPTPAFPTDRVVKPIEPFLQSQIIIAELNLLKLKTGTISSTPLPIPVDGKTPVDVYNEATLMSYLLDQISVSDAAGAPPLAQSPAPAH